MEECIFITQLLNLYERAIEQTINLEKIHHHFWLKKNIRVQIQEALGIYREGGDGHYPGLPDIFNGSKIKVLSFLQNNMKDKVSWYYASFISQGGKEVLIKSVVMSFSVHTIDCLKLLKTTCDNLASTISDSWWNSVEHKKKIHWTSWDKICLPKHLGGVEFKDILIFNQTFLAKQVWRIIRHPETLFARYLKSRYFPDSDLLEAELGSNPSYAWRSIIFGRDLLVPGLRQMIGNGRPVSVWMGRWLNDGRMGAPLIRNGFIDLDLKVADLIEEASKWWDIYKLRTLFYLDDVQLILKLKPTPKEEDFWCWEHNKNDDYTVRSGY